MDPGMNPTQQQQQHPHPQHQHQQHQQHQHQQHQLHQQHQQHQQQQQQQQQLQQHQHQLQQQQHSADQALESDLDSFWKRQLQEVSDATDFKNHNLPLARIKKIMKSDEDVRMISAEAPVLFAKACEMFILELTIRAWSQTEEAKRRTLQRSDISAAIQKTEVFDFLIDIVPRDDPKKEEVARPAAGVGENQIPFYSIPPNLQYLPQQGATAPGQPADGGLHVYQQGVGAQGGGQGVYAGGYGAANAPGAVYNPQQMGMMSSQMQGQYMNMRQQVPYYPGGQFPANEQPDQQQVHGQPPMHPPPPQ